MTRFPTPPPCLKKQIAFFSQHIRNPLHKIKQPTHTATNNVTLYSEFTQQLFSGQLSAYFNRSHLLIGDDAWMIMVSAYLQQQNFHDPCYTTMPYDFACHPISQSLTKKYPWLADFLQYEWLHHPSFTHKNRVLQPQPPYNTTIQWLISHHPLHLLYHHTPTQDINLQNQWQNGAKNKPQNEPYYYVFFYNQAQQHQQAILSSLSYHLLQYIQQEPHASYIMLLKQVIVLHPTPIRCGLWKKLHHMIQCHSLLQHTLRMLRAHQLLF